MTATSPQIWFQLHLSCYVQVVSVSLLEPRTVDIAARQRDSGARILSQILHIFSWPLHGVMAMKDWHMVRLAACWRDLERIQVELKGALSFAVQ